MLTEMLHIAAGLAATWAIVAAAAWGYPLGRQTLEAIGWVVSGVVVLMGIGPMRRAWLADDRRLRER